jgi:hypothetical protein
MPSFGTLCSFCRLQGEVRRRRENKQAKATAS